VTFVAVSIRRTSPPSEGPLVAAPAGVSSVPVISTSFDRKISSLTLAEAGVTFSVVFSLSFCPFSVALDSRNVPSVEPALRHPLYTTAWAADEPPVAPAARLSCADSIVAPPAQDMQTAPSVATTSPRIFT